MARQCRMLSVRSEGRELVFELRGFWGRDPAASHLWPRWSFLRLLGLIQLVFFVEFARSGRALIGPDGLMPIAHELAAELARNRGFWSAFFANPSLLWFSDSNGMIVFLAVAGLLAGACQLANLVPRAAALVAWVCAVSLVNGSNIFTTFQHDTLLCEATFVAIFLAPRGWRPGLGRDSPPRPLAIFAARWVLFRLMFGSGLGKLLSGEPRWRDFTAMDIHHETNPFPTVLGYWDHFLPHWYHVLEVVFTFVAELVAPLLALLGRRGRVAAFVIWFLFQAGIELTGNYGFLNLLAVALGLLLLDDQAIAAVLHRAAAVAVPPRPLAGIRRWLFNAPLVAAIA